MGFSRQEYWSGLPCPPPGDLPKLGGPTHISCGSHIAGKFFTTERPGKPIILISGFQNVIWDVLVFSRSAEVDYHKLVT